MEQPLINPELADLLKDRIISAQLLVDITKLMQKEKNAGFKAGYNCGVEWVSENVSQILDKISSFPTPEDTEHE